MRKPLFNKLKFCILMSMSVFLLSGESVEPRREKAFFHGYLIQKPIIRIGLGINLEQIKIAASSGMKIYEVTNSYRLIAEDVDEVLIQGNREKLNEKYVIQVAQTRDRKEAESISQELKPKIDRKIYIANNLEDGINGTFKVKVGDFISRGDALVFITKLNQLGVKDTWIIREEITDEESKPLWILINDELKSLNDDTFLYFIPNNSQSYLVFKGRDYRGILTLKATKKGIVLINTLNLEDYIKAVVPSELSPYDFPELEAHKAQAVAARTYAFKNLGQFESLGFDLDDTPRTQFYKGMSAEHPLSSLAVEQTRGEMVLFKGKLIDALYTSTCGGATENVENVFLGPSLPYLRSVECIDEKHKGWHLESENSLLPVYLNGKNVSPQIALLISLGIIPEETSTAFYYDPVSSV